MTTTRTLTPDTFDPLATFEPTKVTTAQLAEGMLLLDELNTAVATLDHRVGRVAGGLVQWMVEDLEGSRGWYCVTFAVSANPNVTVADGVRLVA